MQDGMPYDPIQGQGHGASEGSRWRPRLKISTQEESTFSPGLIFPTWELKNKQYYVFLYLTFVTFAKCGLNLFND